MYRAAGCQAGASPRIFGGGTNRSAVKPTYPQNQKSPDLGHYILSSPLFGKYLEGSSENRYEGSGGTSPTYFLFWGTHPPFPASNAHGGEGCSEVGEGGGGGGSEEGWRRW